MPLELLWLLLPVAAASGWWTARRSGAVGRARGRRAEFGPEYFKGINFLLNEQPDRAIEVFIKMLAVDSETVEPHFALGSLFRRQGEVDRAIRIHQNLIARPALTREQRHQALYELAQDYLQAGLLDRAENLFQELVQRESNHESALRCLISIYEQEKDWEQAIAVSQALTARTGGSLRGTIAHYYCELAELAAAENDVARARKMTKRALASDSNCVRASVLAGRIEAGAGNYKAAIRAFKRVEQQDPEYLSEVVGRLLECYDLIGRPVEGIEYMRHALLRQGAAQPVLVFADYLHRHQGEAAAEAYLTEYLNRHPSLSGLDRLVEYRITSGEADTGGGLEKVRGVINKLLEQIPQYFCKVCGFKGKVMHWQCPSCKGWNCVKPYPGGAH